MAIESFICLQQPSISDILLGKRWYVRSYRLKYAYPICSDILIGKRWYAVSYRLKYTYPICSALSECCQESFLCEILNIVKFRSQPTLNSISMRRWRHEVDQAISKISSLFQVQRDRYDLEIYVLLILVSFVLIESVPICIKSMTMLIGCIPILIGSIPILI
jgi:hypothetical protein